MQSYPLNYLYQIQSFRASHKTGLTTRVTSPMGSMLRSNRLRALALHPPRKTSGAMRRWGGIKVDARSEAILLLL